MQDADKKEFASIVKVTWQTYSKPEPDRETMRYWFSKMENFDIRDVGNAFDNWIMHSNKMPTVKDIIDLLKPKESDYKALPKKIDLAAQHKHAEELKHKIEEMVKPKRDMKLWARKILDNPTAYKEISIRYATEALNEKLIHEF